MQCSILQCARLVNADLNPDMLTCIVMYVHEITYS